MPEPAMKLGQILMYKSGAVLDQTTLQALKDQGFIPVAVSSFDDMRLIDRTGGTVPAEEMLLNAVTAINSESTGSDIKLAFLRNMVASIQRAVCVPPKK